MTRRLFAKLCGLLAVGATIPKEEAESSSSSSSVNSSSSTCSSSDPCESCAPVHAGPLVIYDGWIFPPGTKIVVTG